MLAVQLKCRDASAGLKYRLSTSMSPGPDEYYARGAQMQEYAFGEVDTPAGRVAVAVQYLSANPGSVTPDVGGGGVVQLMERRERSISCPADPAEWLADAVAAVNTARTPLWQLAAHKNKTGPDRPPLGHSPLGDGHGGPHGLLKRSLRAESEPNMEMGCVPLQKSSFPFKSHHCRMGPGLRGRQGPAPPDGRGRRARRRLLPEYGNGHHSERFGGSASGGRSTPTDRGLATGLGAGHCSPHAHVQQSPRQHAPGHKFVPSPRMGHGQPSSLLAPCRSSPGSVGLSNAGRMTPDFVLGSPAMHGWSPGTSPAAPAFLTKVAALPCAPARPALAAPYGVRRRQEFAATPLKASSPFAAEPLLAGSIQALFADTHLGVSPQGVTWASELRCARGPAAACESGGAESARPAAVPAWFLRMAPRARFLTAGVGRREAQDAAGRRQERRGGGTGAPRGGAGRRARQRVPLCGGGGRGWPRRGAERGARGDRQGVRRGAAAGPSRREPRQQPPVGAAPGGGARLTRRLTRRAWARRAMSDADTDSLLAQQPHTHVTVVGSVLEPARGAASAACLTVWLSAWGRGQAEMFEELEQLQGDMASHDVLPN